MEAYCYLKDIEMNFEWEEIHNNSHDRNQLYFEETYRAEVVGGWLIRHQVYSDYQYACTDSCEDDPAHRHIQEEGYQKISHTMTFIRDPKHEWGLSIMDGCLVDECL